MGELVGAGLTAHVPTIVLPVDETTPGAVACPPRMQARSTLTSSKPHVMPRWQRAYVIATCAISRALSASWAPGTTRIRFSSTALLMTWRKLGIGGAPGLSMCAAG